MELTIKQQSTLEIIARYWNSKGFSPSIADIRNELKLSKNSNGTVVFRIKSLEKAGLITRNPKMARSIKLTELGKKYLSMSRNQALSASATTVSTNFNIDAKHAQISNYTMKERL